MVKVSRDFSLEKRLHILVKNKDMKPIFPLNKKSISLLILFINLVLGGRDLSPHMDCLKTKLNVPKQGFIFESVHVLWVVSIRLIEHAPNDPQNAHANGSTSLFEICLPLCAPSTFFLIPSFLQILQLQVVLASLYLLVFVNSLPLAISYLQQ